MRIVWRILAGVALSLIVWGASLGTAKVAKAEKPRNPFGVQDIPDPDGEDVQQFAARFLLGGAKDPNAEQWVKDETQGKKGSLEGEWFDRWNSPGSDWNYGKGPSKIKVVGNRVFILVDASNGKFLLDLKREKDRLVGKFQGVDNPNDTGPAVLVIVDDERIDGNWAGQGRWDFRRRIK